MSDRTLLIDDLRELPADYIARTFSEGLSALEFLGPWSTLKLDHDLASFDANGREHTGYDVVKYLAENLHLRPTKVYLVTSNPVGMRNMGDTLVNIGYKKISPREFHLT